MWRNPQKVADLFTFTKEIFYRNLHFLCGNNYLMSSFMTLTSDLYR